MAPAARSARLVDQDYSDDSGSEYDSDEMEWLAAAEIGQETAEKAAQNEGKGKKKKKRDLVEDALFDAPNMEPSHCKDICSGICFTLLTMAICTASQYIAMLPLIGQVAWLPMTLIYIIYGWSCWRSPVRKYLCSACSEDALEKYVEKLQEAKPKVTFKVECGHTQAGGGVNSYKVTHQAEKDYALTLFKDTTPSVQDTFASGRPGYYLCFFYVQCSPANIEVEKHKNAEKEAFFAKESKDEVQKKTEEYTVDWDMFAPHMMVQYHENDRPWWMASWCYWLSSLFLLTVPFRCCFYSRTASITWAVNKTYTNAAAKLA